MKKLAALALLLVLAASVFGAYSSFRGLGAGFVAVGIATDRAGLSMNPGAMVKMNGVEVGRVATVSSTESGAVLEDEHGRIGVEQAHSESPVAVEGSGALASGERASANWRAEVSRGRR